MKWRRARSPKGTSATCTPWGYQRDRIGKFGRCRWGAAPIAVSRLVARARWSISCLVTSTITASQAATLASCSAPSPSSALEGELGEQVLTHQPVLQLTGLDEQPDELLPA